MITERTAMPSCHAMFGLEKPRWHYTSEFGAFLGAVARKTQALPEARSRFLSRTRRNG